MIHRLTRLFFGIFIELKSCRGDFMKLWKLILLGLMLSTAACSKKNSSSSTSYTAEQFEAEVNIGATCAPMNTFNGNVDTGLRANVETAGYTTQTTYFDYVQVQLSALPASFYNGNGIIEFYRYTLLNGQGPISDNTPLSIDIVPLANPYNQSRGHTRVTANEIAGFNLDEFVLVVNVGSSAQLLDMSYFDGNGAYIGSNYGLLPPYTANPEVYHQDKEQTFGSVAADEMYKHHPLRSSPIGQDGHYYKDLAESQFCFNGIPRE